MSRRTVGLFVAIAVACVVKLVCPLAYLDVIAEVCDRLELDFYLIAALIRVESSFKPDAVSQVGACGLMQLMPETAKYVAQANGLEFLPEKLFEPKYNVELGCMYMKELILRYRSDERSALAAYNAGPQVVDRWLAGRKAYLDTGEIEFSETREFVRKVQIYRRLYALVYSLPLKLYWTMREGGSWK
ncbi:MAG: lytic transglycosylase domain-containing protein [Bacillota bacterium]